MFLLFVFHAKSGNTNNYWPGSSDISFYSHFNCEFDEINIQNKNSPVSRRTGEHDYISLFMPKLHLEILVFL